MKTEIPWTLVSERLPTESILDRYKTVYLLFDYGEITKCVFDTWFKTFSKKEGDEPYRYCMKAWCYEKDVITKE